MNPIRSNRFEDFFIDEKYLFLKNDLYNYQLRKIAIKKTLEFNKEKPKLVLEIGSGISPMIEPMVPVVYTDTSMAALLVLKRNMEGGFFVLADAMNLPFKADAFSHAICSEVLEHIEDDRRALTEIARTIEPSGRFVLTFPHRKAYFANDDKYVNHFRRYELTDMVSQLRINGFSITKIKKILGPLEKITMALVVYLFSSIGRLDKGRGENLKKTKLLSAGKFLFRWANLLYMVFIWLDAKISPRDLSTVLFIDSVLSDSPSSNSKKMISSTHFASQL